MGRPWAAIAAIAVALSLSSACTASRATRTRSEPPATIAPIAGTNLNRVVLSPTAAQRIGIKTAPVQKIAVPKTSVQRLVVPYSSVVYDTHGNTWAYASLGPDVFVRKSIRIDSIDGDRVVLSDGPPSGTEVVSIGAAELYGLEFRAT